MTDSFLITFIYSALILGSIAAVLSIEYFSNKSGAVPMPSMPWLKKAILSSLQTELSLKEGKKKKNSSGRFIAYELGSAWGGIALYAAKHNPQLHVIGYELSPIPFFFSCIRAKLSGLKNIEFKRGNFLDISLKDADFITMYLTPAILETLVPKLEKELKKECIVLCHTFPISTWKPKTLEKVAKIIYDFHIYVYEIGTHKKT